jgi:hypothetical protein
MGLRSNLGEICTLDGTLAIVLAYGDFVRDKILFESLVNVYSPLDRASEKRRFKVMHPIL